MTTMADPEALGLPRGRALTRDDLETMPDDGHRYELLDGILVVSPGSTFRHQSASVELLVALKAAVVEPWVVIHAPFDVVLADDTVLQPDLLIASREDFTDRDLPSAPMLAVEILSPSTRNIDLLLKKERLQRAGCRHYWVVDPDEPSITAWTLVDGRYERAARAVGEDFLEIAEPFAFRLAPASLDGRRAT